MSKAWTLANNNSSLTMTNVPDNVKNRRNEVWVKWEFSKIVTTFLSI